MSEPLLVLTTIGSLEEARGAARECLPRLRTELLGIHPYEVPEFFALPMSDLYEPYQAWLFECVRGVKED